MEGRPLLRNQIAMDVPSSGSEIATEGGRDGHRTQRNGQEKRSIETNQRVAIGGLHSATPSRSTENIEILLCHVSARTSFYFLPQYLRPLSGPFLNPPRFVDQVLSLAADNKHMACGVVNPEPLDFGSQSATSAQIKKTAHNFQN